MHFLVVGDWIARFLLAFVFPSRICNRIRENVAPPPIYILASQTFVDSNANTNATMTLIEGVFTTIMFDLALFGTDNIVINTIIRYFTKFQNRWDRPFASPQVATLAITQFCRALHIQTNPWIWDRPIEEYSCLNDFFARKYSPDYCMEIGNAEIVSPACCNMRYYFNDDMLRSILVKGCEYSIDKIGLPSDHGCWAGNDSSITVSKEKYGMNPIFLGYLSPTDYHRVHSPARGRCIHCCLEGPKSLSSSVKFFGGRFNILNENTRLIIVLETGERKEDMAKARIALIIIGGVGVNTIIYDRNQLMGRMLEKGEEVASFRAGGSAIAIYSTHPMKVTPDFQAGLNHSSHIKVMMGEPIANL